jgi:hypothetical protein
VPIAFMLALVAGRTVGFLIGYTHRPTSTVCSARNITPGSQKRAEFRSRTNLSRAPRS